MSGRQLGKTAIFKLFGSDGDQISALGALVALGKEYEIPHMRYEHLFDLEDGLHAGLSICSGSSSSSNSQQRAGLVLTRLTQGRSRMCGTPSDVFVVRPTLLIESANLVVDSYLAWGRVHPPATAVAAAAAAAKQRSNQKWPGSRNSRGNASGRRGGEVSSAAASTATASAVMSSSWTMAPHRDHAKVCRGAERAEAALDGHP